MKKEFVLNFWHALLLFVGIRIIAGTLSASIGLLFKDMYYAGGVFRISLQYLEYLLYVPFIFWFLKKTNTNIRQSLFMPDLMTAINMIVILLLARIFVLTPLINVEEFIASLMNSSLRIVGSNTKTLFPFYHFYAIVFVPIIEELFFRGLVLKNFLKRYSPVYAILLSSLLFGAHHLSIALLPYYIIFGILFGIIYYGTNSLIIVTLAHVFVNALSQFQWEYIELNMTNSIIHLLIYITAFVWLVYLIRKSVKKVNASEEVEIIKDSYSKNI